MVRGVVFGDGIVDVSSSYDVYVICGRLASHSSNGMMCSFGKRRRDGQTRVTQAQYRTASWHRYLRFPSQQHLYPISNDTSILTYCPSFPPRNHAHINNEHESELATVRLIADECFTT